MNSEVITAQPVSGEQAAGTARDEPPSYNDVVTTQPQPQRAGEDQQNVAPSPGEDLRDHEHGDEEEEENNEEAEKKKRNRRQADDDCLWCCVSDDDDCLFIRLFSNCCIGIGNCTESCCEGCADCLHECCDTNVQTAGVDTHTGCCVDCCGSGDGGGTDTDCDCNCFD